MDIEINREILSLAMRFYSRALMYPYDEQTHEFQHLFRELEKSIETDADNTIAAKVLDVINFYQGEDMITLQSEYVRLFTPRDDQAPFISMHIQDLNPNVDIDVLLDELQQDALFEEVEDEPELMPYIMEHFSSILEYEEYELLEKFYELYLKETLPVLARAVYNGSNINFYKEFSKGLNEIVELLE